MSVREPLQIGQLRLSIMADSTWKWDESLYSGSAVYYTRGRVAYPTALADVLRTELHLDGSGRLLDVGCGPGSLTLLLADMFDQVTGIDADPGMIEEAGRRASQVGQTNVVWRRMRAEELPAALGMYTLVTFAQSFHWMDRAKVAAIVHSMLAEGGACVHVHARTHRGVPSEAALPFPEPPHSAIDELVRQYLGSVRRAGRGYLVNGAPDGEAEMYKAAGFSGPQRFEIPGKAITRRTDDIVASVFSLSGSTPSLFGDQCASFEAELRQLLLNTNPAGLFSEQMREIAVDIWRP